MLFLEKNPKMCANATPVCFIEHIISSAQTAFKAVQKGESETLEEKTLPSLLVMDWNSSYKNIEWCQIYFDTLIENYSIATNKQLSFINLSELTFTEVNDNYFIAPVHIHSPLADSFYEEIYKEHFELYNQLNVNNTIVSRQILADLRPEHSDFVHGQPSWLVLFTEPEVFSAYDITTMMHYRITRDSNNNYHYHTAYMGGEWEEIKSVPAEMAPIILYLLSNRANLTLVNET